MRPDDRFLPQGKQILPEICQVRPMPIAKAISLNLKAHVHPNGFARLCFCFEMILLSNAVF